MKQLSSRRFWGLGEDPASIVVRREGAELTGLVARVLLGLDGLVLLAMWQSSGEHLRILLAGTGSLALFLLLTLGLVRAGRPRLGAWAMCLGLLLADFVSMMMAGLVDVGPATAILTVTAVAGATLGPLASTIFAVLSSMAVFFVTCCAAGGSLRDIPARAAPWTAAMGVAAALVALAVLMVILFHTRLKSIERELDVSQERDAARVAYLQSQKLEALGRMAGGIAHDFNNLLGVVRASADILRVRGRDAKVADRILSDLDSAVERATLMTERLLAFSRNRTEGRRAADVAGVASDLVPLLARLVGARIEVLLDGAEQPLWVKVDPTELEQVLMNLAVNARDAMPEGGLLRILLGTEDADTAVIVVEDTGVGIPPDVTREIFAPFFSTKRTGTGLGLATVRDIVERAGGRIEVASQINEGTTFRIFLRRTAPGTKVRATPSEAGLPRAPGRALLVEDHDLSRRATTQLLESLGFEVVAVTNGAEALALMDARVPFDVIVTDKIMPRLSGLELAVHVRERGLTCPIVIVSGDGAGVPSGVELKVQPCLFLAKPFSLGELVRSLSDLLDRPLAPRRRDSSSADLAPHVGNPAHPHAVHPQEAPPHQVEPPASGLARRGDETPPRAGRS